MIYMYHQQRADPHVLLGGVSPVALTQLRPKLLLVVGKKFGVYLREDFGG